MISVAPRHAARGARMAWHRHANACVTCVATGELREEFSDGVLVCSPGTVLLKPAGVRHRAAFSADCNYLHIELQPGLAEGLTQPRANAALNDAPALAVPMTQLRREFGRREPSRLILRGLAYQMVGELGRLAPDDTLPGWVVEARRLTESAAGSRLRPAEIATAVGRHPAQLNRMFRRHFGCSVGELRRAWRLSAAARLLRDSDQSLSAIAIALGFVDQSHFTRAFRERFGMPPGRFRRLEQ